MRVAASCPPLTSGNNMTASNRKTDPGGGGPGDRSTRLARRQRAGAVRGTETSNEAATAAVTSPDDCGREKGPGGYAPTIVPTTPPAPTAEAGHPGARTADDRCPLPGRAP